LSVVLFRFGVSLASCKFVFKVQDLALSRLQNFELLELSRLRCLNNPLGLGNSHLIALGFLFVKLLERITGHSPDNRKFAVRGFLQSGFSPLFPFLVLFEVSCNSLADFFNHRFSDIIFFLINNIWLSFAYRLDFIFGLSLHRIVAWGIESFFKCPSWFITSFVSLSLLSHFRQVEGPHRLLIFSSFLHPHFLSGCW